MEPTIEEKNAELAKHVAALTGRSELAEKQVTEITAKLTEVSDKLKAAEDANKVLADEKSKLVTELEAERSKATTVAATAAKLVANAGVSPANVSPAGEERTTKSNKEYRAEFVKIQQSGDAKAAREYYEKNHKHILNLK